MAAITETHKAANDAMARYWMQCNGFQSVNGRWMEATTAGLAVSPRQVAR